MVLGKRKVDGGQWLRKTEVAVLCAETDFQQSDNRIRAIVVTQAATYKDSTAEANDREV